MEKKLVLAVKQVRNVVIGYVVKQDEGLGGLLAEIKGFRIRSNTCPELSNLILYVRGSHSFADDKVFCYAYPTTAETIQAVESIRRCVSKINEAEPDYPVEDGFEIIE